MKTTSRVVKLRFEPLEDRRLLSGWAIGFGGTGRDTPYDVVIDSTGHAAVVGYFNETADFDPGLGEQALISVGDADGYLARYSPDGALDWVRQLAIGKSHCVTKAVAVDSHDNLYAAGLFHESAQFDSQTLVGGVYPNDFVAKYSSEGTFQWAQHLADGAGTSHAYDVTIGPDQSVYVTGEFSGTAQFGPYTLNSVVGKDIFVAKLRPSDGTVLWARRMGGANGNGYGLTADDAGYLYLAGTFTETGTFGSHTLTSAGGRDAVVTKIDTADGSVLWARRLGGSGEEHAYAIARDSQGDLYISGWFEETANFGGHVLNSAGNRDGFVTKMDSNGNVAWARRFGGTEDDDCRRIAIDAEGNLNTVGRFKETVDFDPGPDTAFVTSRGIYDAFLLRLDPDGQYLGAWRMGSTQSEFGVGIDFDAEGYAYVAGSFSESADFPNGTLTSAGSRDAFLLKLPSDLPVPVNEPPVANPDAYRATTGVLLDVPAPGVLGNDIDVNYDQLQASVVDRPAHGTFRLDADGSFTYRSASGFRGIDSFTYRVNDSLLDSEVATVTIAVGLPGVSIGGTLFDDLDGDGVADPGEPGLPGQTVYRQPADDRPLQTFVNPEPDSNDDFGYALAVAGDKLVISSPQHGTFEPFTDAVHLFDIATGQLLRTFRNPTPNTWNAFARHVAVLGDNVLIGHGDGWAVAPDKTFLYSGTTGSLLRTFPGKGPLATIDGNVLIGAITDYKTYLFDGSSGVLLRTFSPPAIDYNGEGLSYSRFGSSVAAMGSNVLIGAEYSDAGAKDAGAVHLFNASTGRLLRTFVRPDPVAGEYGFGQSVSAVGNNVAISDSPRKQVYLFDGQTGDLIRTLTSPRPGDWYFGRTVAGVGDNVAVRGSQNVFVFDGATGELLQTISVIEPRAMAAYGNDILVQSWFDHPGALGQVHLFSGTHTTVTDAAGRYGFDNVPPGYYSVRMEPGENSVLTTPLEDGAYRELIIGDDDVTGLDFGVQSGTAPVAEDDAYVTDEDQTLDAPVGLLANDTDAEGDALTTVLVGVPSHGSVSVEADGSFTYTPEANFHGIDTFTYRANDGLFDSNEATVTITIRPINDAPSASDDSYTTDVGVGLSSVTPGLLANDRDIDGDSLTTVKVTDPAHAQYFHIEADGSFIYIPKAGYLGPDSFIYRANDGTENSAPVTVTIAVGAEFFYPGDADLNGVTDVRDFMIWNLNKFTDGTDWTTGDFDGNAITDVRDFMIWNLHKFTSASVPAPVQAVDHVFDSPPRVARILEPGPPDELAWLDELLDAASTRDEDEKSDEAVDKLLAFYW